MKVWRGLRISASQHWLHLAKYLKIPVPRLHPRISEAKTLKNVSIGSIKGKKTENKNKNQKKPSEESDEE